MDDVADSPELHVNVRFFAAAKAAAKVDESLVTLQPGATVAWVVSELSCRSDELAHVLQRCSYLCDGIAVRDLRMKLHAGQTVDVLPPFAGG